MIRNLFKHNATTGKAASQTQAIDILIASRPTTSCLGAPPNALARRTPIDDRIRVLTLILRGVSRHTLTGLEPTDPRSEARYFKQGHLGTPSKDTLGGDPAATLTVPG